MLTLVSSILAIVGALNWLVVGAFQFDLVAFIFGSNAAIMSRVIYILVGLAGIWLAIHLVMTRGKTSSSAKA